MSEQSNNLGQIPGGIAVWTADQVTDRWRILNAKTYAKWVRTFPHFTDEERSSSLRKVADFLKQKTSYERLSYNEILTILQNEPLDKHEPPFFVIGHPGQGKTMTAMAAVDDFVNFMGLRPVRNPTDESCIRDPNDLSSIDKKVYVIWCPNLTSHADSKAATGMMTIDEKGNPRLTPVPAVRAMSIAPGVIIFDDLRNSFDHVLAALHSALDDQRTFGEVQLRHILIGGTSNFGDEDRTAANEGNSAFFNRISLVALEFSATEFANYLSSPAAGLLCGEVYSMFVRRLKADQATDLLNQKISPSDDVTTRIGNSRTWTGAFRTIDGMLYVLMRRDSDLTEPDLHEIKRLLRMNLNEDCASRFTSFVRELQADLRSATMFLSEASYPMAGMNKIREIADTKKSVRSTDASLFIFKIVNSLNYNLTEKTFGAAVALAILAQVIFKANHQNLLFARFHQVLKSMGITEDMDKLGGWIREVVAHGTLITERLGEKAEHPFNGKVKSEFGSMITEFIRHVTAEREQSGNDGLTVPDGGGVSR
jgi:hypothetical protein